MTDFLDKQVFMSMLHFEEIILGGQVSRDIIHELIGLYAQCVEFYDSLHDPIQFYFLEKMQILLARESTLREIGIFKQHKGKIKPTVAKLNIESIHRNEQKDNSKIMENAASQNDKFTTPKGQLKAGEYESGESEEQEYKRESKRRKNINQQETKDNNNDGYESEDSDYQTKEGQSVEDTFKGLSMAEMRLKYKQTPRHAKYSISKKRLERSKRVGMYLQLQNEQATTLDAGELFQKHINISAAQVDTVKQNLNLQLEDFQKRLQKRKTIKEGQGMTPRPQLTAEDQALENQDPMQFCKMENQLEEA